MTEVLGAADLIDRVLESNDFVSTSGVAQRKKALRNLKRVTKFVWSHRNWFFRYIFGDFTATDGVFTIADFVSFGPDGGLYIDGTFCPLTWVPRNKYRQLLHGTPQTGRPRHYTELGVLDDETSIGLYPAFTGELSAEYMVSAPEVTDANPGGLDAFPLEWRDTVLYEYLVLYQMKDRGNVQSRTEQGGIAAAALAQMVAECRGGRQAPHRIAPYGVRLRGY